MVQESQTYTHVIFSSVIFHTNVICPENKKSFKILRLDCKNKRHTDVPTHAGSGHKDAGHTHGPNAPLGCSLALSKLVAIFVQECHTILQLPTCIGGLGSGNV